jgi:hypothetical protein
LPHAPGGRIIVAMAQPVAPAVQPAAATGPDAVAPFRDALVPVAAVLLLLTLGLCGIAAGMALLLSIPDAGGVDTALLVTGVVLALSTALPLVFGTVRRDWHLTPDAVGVEAAPWFLPARLGRTRHLPLAGLTRIETIRVGARPAMRLVPDRGRPWVLMAATDAPFARALMARAATLSGRAVPVVPGGHLFVTLPGLALILLCLVVSLGIAGTVLWMLWDGAFDDGPARPGQGIALALGLPVLAGWWLVASLRQRRTWRRSLRKGTP